MFLSFAKGALHHNQKISPWRVPGGKIIIIQESQIELTHPLSLLKTRSMQRGLTGHYTTFHSHPQRSQEKGSPYNIRSVRAVSARDGPGQAICTRSAIMPFVDHAFLIKPSTLIL